MQIFVYVPYTCQICLQASTVLGVLLQQNPNLEVLSLAGNTGLPDRLFRAALLSASCSSLKTLDLSDCELIRTGELVPSSFPNLLRLCISNTSAADADVRQFATQLSFLQHLDLTGCRKVSCRGIGLSSPAVFTVHSVTIPCSSQDMGSFPTCLGQYKQIRVGRLLW